MSNIWFTIELANGSDLFITKGNFLGILCFLIAFTVRRVSVSQSKKWQTALKHIDPTLKCLDPPMVTAYQGVSGCLWSKVLDIIWISLVFWGIDLTMLGGGLLWSNRIRILAFLARTIQG